MADTMTHKDESKERVCPARFAFLLDNRLRRWLTGTRNIANTYLRKGMTVLDVGCGPAPMLLDIARVIGPEGKIICTDIQQPMLDWVQRKAVRADIASQVDLRLTEPDTLGVEPATIDFAIAFWMLHETPDPEQYLIQILSTLKPGGRFLLIEPKGHVKPEVVEQMADLAIKNGMNLEQHPRIRMSNAVLLEKNS